ncbi:zinc-ribbon domain-containing protein [Flintibacter sp. HCN-6482]|uniref:zinc-ribbon domain-containing protein n=1 Tax=Flintibacter sp. HCN-6482 TaxID=3134672 RepID=UPI00403FD4AD
MREVECPSCRAKNPDRANFCKSCGTKLKEVCDCWIKKEPYNCGQEKCPGYRLFVVEKSKT